VVLCIQPISLFTEASCVKRYYLGIHGFWASLISILVIGIQAAVLWSAGKPLPTNPTCTILLSTQLALYTLRGLSCLLLPRRPHVFFEGQVVDQEFSSSAYNRFTYGWATTLLRYASANKGLTINDLPKLPFAARAETVHIRLEGFLGGRKLWVALVRRHMRALIVQGLLSLVVCVLGFGPQVALYKILTTLEAREVLSGDSVEAWVWVCGLGVLLALSSSIESWLWWLIYSDLWVPIYEGLSGLVFAKAMRCKDVKAAKSERRDEEGEGWQGEDDMEVEDPEEVEEQEKNRQSIVNLAAVDSKRIADFVTFSYLIPSCVIRLGIAAIFLARLIGWPSLLAGIGGAILLTPLNSWLTKRYAVAQEELMKASDKRAGAVTEVLQGIRQIKFGAMEQQWQERVKEKREAELSFLWKTSVYTTGMVSVWIMGPLLLSAVSLTVYALTHGNLSPSVAFTALSIFGSLESSLASLPDLFSKAMEAKVSADRIHDYLQSAEKISNAADVDKITFTDATVAWPSDEEEEDKGWECDRFLLRHLALQFPPKGLSVIVGKTGSGKSLLLASILGECDVLAGSLAVPRPPPPDRFDHLATRVNWILDTAVAYVSQNPWMENASIKQNILFGLPYDRQRYRKTLFASGLEKDMAILTDGDLTDIGANGINLSGGQRWRISFARALYSRAGILIMDDIFSALDAETGRHVYEHALTGELGRGRTRILATHHVGLCLPKTDYCVLLQNGFASAGTVEELQATGSLTDFMGKIEASREESEPVKDLPKRKRSSVASGRRSSAFSMHTIRKFMQEEKRETGSISMKVYTTYFNKGNGLWCWILAFIAYAAFMALLVGRVSLDLIPSLEES
jgi:ABC-type multidrug transport system fused ATPase/permease subunit